MRLTFTLSLLSTLLAPALAFLTTRQVYEFPVGTWIENLAVRPTGPILVTTLSGPDVYQINSLASNPTASLVHRFPSGHATIGITECGFDDFYVVVGNYTIGQQTIPPGHQIWRIKYPPLKPSGQPEVSLTASIPDAGLLNGLTPLNAKTILAADSRRGAIWSIDVTTGTSKVVNQDPILAPGSAPPGIGVNGIRVRGEAGGLVLYFTNSATATFGKISIHGDGTPAGAAVVIATAATGTGYDDFALDILGNAFLATGPGDSVAEVKRNGKQRVIAGVEGSTEIAEPTSARFGRTLGDLGVLYVTTAGGLGAPVGGTQKVGGQLVAVDLKGLVGL